jgi:hypothetical protein
VQLAVLLGLAALWVAVLLPDILRRRGSRRTGDSISNFTHHLSVLERSNPLGRGSSRRTASNVVPFARRTPAPASSPTKTRVAPMSATGVPMPLGGQQTRMTRSQAHQRRQDVIVGLGAASLLTFLATLAFGGPLLFVHLAVDLALLAYLGLVLQVTRRSQGRADVAYLNPSPRLNRAMMPAHEQRSSAAR